MGFPNVLDSTIISSFRSCPTRFHFEYIENWKPRSVSIHLHAGAAYAAALEAGRKAFFFEGATAPDAEALAMGTLIREYGDFECPEDSAKSLERMMGALDYYFANFPLDQDKAIPVSLPGGGQGVEFSFAEPLPFFHPETGDPLLYAGRMDMVADFAGRVYGFDDKTTSQLGAQWYKQWTHRSQFTGYCWAARQNSIPLAGIIVRGISILKTKYDHQQVVADRAEWEIERWYAQLLRDVERMLASYKSGVWDYSLDHACGEFGGCTFMNPCKSPDPQPWLETGFARRVWNPLNRTEEEVV